MLRFIRETEARENMKIEVEIPEDKITRLVLDRIGELFSEDARYRETAVRTAVHRIVDETAERVVRDAADRS